jgi:hypothetical protein
MQSQLPMAAVAARCGISVSSLPRRRAIIETRQTGVQDPVELSRLAIKKLNTPKQSTR